jgi:oxaloacetate decarboxylase alpha subunit
MAAPVAAAPAAPSDAEPVTAPLAGNIWKVEVSAGQHVEEGDVLLILEAMKMETQIVAPKAGVVSSISVKPGDAVKVGDLLASLS